MRRCLVSTLQRVRTPSALQIAGRGVLDYNKAYATQISNDLGRLALALVFSATVCGCRSLGYIHRAKERPYDLWMAALKGFEGPVYYVGSDGDFSYFRAGDVFYSRYKVQTEKIRLPDTFPFGKGEPYRVKQEMVPYYSP